MVTELKRIPEICDFFITEDVSETLYANLKKDVLAKIREIEDFHSNNREFYRNNGLDPNDYKPKNVMFTFHLSTFGGDCYTGLGICDFLSNLDRNKNIDVSVFAEGKVMSMGIPILLSVENRYCTLNTTFMIHELSAFTFGKLEKLKENVDEYNRLMDRINDIITSNSKITKDELKHFYEKKFDYFFDAEKALELGLVKSILTNF